MNIKQDSKIACVRDSFPCITPVSLLIKMDPNLGDHTQTRNFESPNKNGRKQTRLNLREKLRQDCKTFIHRFDSDRRLQNHTFEVMRLSHHNCRSRGLIRRDTPKELIAWSVRSPAESWRRRNKLLAG
jgi:hypothetical protein